MKIFATLTSLILATSSTQAAIVWSGIVDIPIPPATTLASGLNGVYIDIATFNFSTVNDDAFASSDVNVFLGGFAIRSSADFRPARLAANATSPILNLLQGSPIDGSLNFGPDGIGVSDTHVGSGSGQFDSGTEGFIGFAFSDAGGPTQYGWMRVTLTSNASGTIHEWAYLDTGEPFEVGLVPEPSVMLLTLLTFPALLRRRR